MTIMYAIQGQYSEAHTRNVLYDLGQIKKQKTRQELDHQMKYRFMYQSDAGDILPIFSKSQTLNAGAGDVLLTFSGYEGSGFAGCENTIQTLTRGSQY
mmetsp:Transcript_30501/g.46751  ORF Transcript_30501/g.46751 Transcript_30501/m.46751 type:complete len:98 (+) Transcript_30501:397-690(+)